MKTNEIIESGLLELYVLGTLEGQDLKLVEQAIIDYPKIRQEVKEIENAFGNYALANQIEPTKSLKQDILSQIKPKSNNATTVAEKTSQPPTSISRSYLWPFIFSVVSALGLLGAYLLQKGQNNDLSNRYIQDQIICDSLQTAVQNNNIMLAELSKPENKVLNVNPTEKYPETSLYIHHNSKTQKNYLQIQNLPLIAENQSYQLWSLKEGSDPIPLDVFGGEEGLFEIKFVEGSNAYAITIEKEGGSQVPNLEELIGVIPVS